MKKTTAETKKKVVREHIQDGRTLNSLASEYGVSHATISNWVRSYREECQTNDAEKSQLYAMKSQVYSMNSKVLSDTER
jgi:transposase